ncbi:unnamed protein product [Effrenium voratum]|uniref:RING-type domain-containing protein n=1 Tax=Effrenium voratum TaxID=2562239 RepID=A0AA36MUI6_9DINO|nr:unnamed protein product [Effrenium voratum]CAJ1453503.1 unnamed protein product [Effrenium voratum]
MDEKVPCSICFEECTPLSMPCCGKEKSTIHYCLPCIEVVCRLGDGLGRCPTCRQCIKADDGRVIVAEETGHCATCRQAARLVEGGQCEACLLGSRFCFSYECSRCRQVQRIPHPMWRYQGSPIEFGTSTWACHQQCGDFTHWRILAEDAARVPDMECPEGWGRREHWMQEVRNHRHPHHQRGGDCSIC